MSEAQDADADGAALHCSLSLPHQCMGGAELELHHSAAADTVLHKLHTGIGH